MGGQEGASRAGQPFRSAWDAPHLRVTVKSSGSVPVCLRQPHSTTTGGRGRGCGRNRTQAGVRVEVARKMCLKLRQGGATIPLSGKLGEKGNKKLGLVPMGE